MDEDWTPHPRAAWLHGEGAEAADLESDPAHSPRALLWAAREIAAFVLADPGAPEELAAEGPLSPSRYRYLPDWIGPLERLTGLVLYLLAMMFPARAPSPRWRAPTRRNLAAHVEDPDDASTWRCTLRLPHDGPLSADDIDPSAPDADQQIALWYALQEKARAHRASAQYSPPLGSRDALPLARRLEAILRALNDPVSAAGRLARRLARRDEQGLRTSMFNTPPRHRHRWPCATPIDRGHAACRALALERARLRDREKERAGAGRLPVSCAVVTDTS